MDYRKQRRQDCEALFAGFQPDFSGCQDKELAQKILELASMGWFSAEIASMVGMTPKAVQKFYRRYGFPSLQNFSPRRREQRQGWKGGVKEVKGYRYVRTPGHPLASKHGSYVAEHRLVMEQTLGRYLLPTEVVDHIDGDTRNNAPDNLRVFASNAEHLAATLRGRCPQWSEEGKARLAAARRRPRRTSKGVEAQPSRAASETDAGQ